MTRTARTALRHGGATCGDTGDLSRRTARAILTASDQAIFSLSNFAVGMAIARVSGAAGLGSYSLAYALWLGIQALHRSLVTDPMAIENDVHRFEADRYLACGLAAELLLGLMAAGLFGLAGAVLTWNGAGQFGLALLALAPWLPMLVTQDYWRWIGFMQSRPGRALANDLVFDGVQVLVFAVCFTAGFRSVEVAITAWGAGAAAGSLYGLRQFGAHVTLRGGWSKLRSHWPMSRWLSASGLTGWGSSQSYAVLAAALLGPAGVGGLRAASTLVTGPALVLLQSGSSLGLPEASRALAERGGPGLKGVTRFITLAATIPVTLIAVVVVLDGGPLLRLFYGAQFGRYSDAATALAVATVVTAAGLGPILTLKATRQTAALFGIVAAQMAISIITVTVLASLGGVTGAAVGMALSCVIGTTALIAIHNRTIRSGLAPSEALTVGSDPSPGTEEAVTT